MRGAWHGGGRGGQRVARVGATTALRPDGVQQRGAHGSAPGSGIRRYCQLTGGPCPAPISSAYVSVTHPPLRTYPRPCLCPCPRPRRCRCLARASERTHRLRPRFVPVEVSSHIHLTHPIAISYPPSPLTLGCLPWLHPVAIAPPTALLSAGSNLRPPLLPLSLVLSLSCSHRFLAGLLICSSVRVLLLFHPIIVFRNFCSFSVLILVALPPRLVSSRLVRAKPSSHPRSLDLPPRPAPPRPHILSTPAYNPKTPSRRHHRYHRHHRHPGHR